MKIGPLDIGIRTLVLVSAAVVIVLLDFRFFWSKRATRVEGFYSSRIPSYLVTDTQREMADGVTQCDRMLVFLPNHTGALMYKATLHYNQKEFDAAEKVFCKVYENSTASAELRAMAAHGIGASVFSKQPETKRAEAAVDAADWFVKALNTDPDLADAKVALCSAIEWRLKLIEGKVDTAEGQAILKQTAGWLASASGEDPPKTATEQSVTAKELALLDTVPEGKHPPSLPGTSQYYNVRGLVLSRAEKLVEAEHAFDAAIALLPRWQVPRKNQFRAMVRLLPVAKMKLRKREALLNKYTSKISRHADDSLVALNSFAVAWFNTREVARTEDYVKIGYPKALALLKRAYDAHGDSKAILTAVAIMDDRLFAPPDKGGVLASVSRDFLMPCPVGEETSYWVGDPPKTRVRKKRPDLRKALLPVYSLAMAMKAVLRDCGRKLRLKPKMATEIKLRLLACDLLIALGTLADDQQSLHTVLPQRARQIKGEASDNPDALIAFAHFMLRTGDYPEAGNALRLAYKAGAKTPEMEKIIATISTPPKLINPRPDKRGWFGQRPLVRATLWSPTSPGQITAGSMSYNDKKVLARIMGGQILYLLPEGRLTNGSHKIKVDAVDGYGNPAELEFSFSIDKIAPKATVMPSDGARVKGPRPTWTVNLVDEETGLDRTSIQVRLSNVGQGATPVRTVLVENGVYRADIPAVGAKRGTPLESDSFKVGSVVDLTPGSYQLRVSFADKSGNEKQQAWTYTVQ